MTFAVGRLPQKNPQANSVCERMHQAIGNTLRVLTTLEPPTGADSARQLVDTAIADAVYAARCTYNSVLKTTPGGLAFGRDMILNIPPITDLQQLQKRDNNSSISVSSWLTQSDSHMITPSKTKY
ncbi:hypothetical protein IV203_036715 [Nitzschia inconspicua]|uniref:Uncharacterized protein n=1 Tax=Nitzschia inconspicua TaxID=303405 RepID=A0A9K3LH64_9STRA|nr:hypothetical protein IV203_036715 [Nitzschia inconspicua]